MRSRSGAALVALAVLAVMPAAADARVKLYSVSLSGTTRTELTQTETIPPPLGCTGSATETKHFVGSARLVAKPHPAPVASYGRLKFNVLLKSLSATYTDDSEGSFTVDQSQPFPPDPSQCTFTPEHKTSRCTFTRDATRTAGAEFALLPLGGRFEFYFNRNSGIVNCEPDDIGAGILREFVVTKLRSSTVKGLGRGASASTSATSVIPARGSTTGGQTVRYALKVKRTQ